MDIYTKTIYIKLNSYAYFLRYWFEDIFFVSNVFSITVHIISHQYKSLVDISLSYFSCSSSRLSVWVYWWFE